MPPTRKKQPKLLCEYILRPGSLLTAAVRCEGFPARRKSLPLSPALCNVHEKQVEVQGLPSVAPPAPSRAERITSAAASSFASSFNAGQFFAGLFGAFAQHATPQPPPPAPAGGGGMSPTIARLVMRFDAGEVLTAEKVKARKRELASKYHPDRQGGDHVAMQELNAAAELLLASL